MVRKLAIELVVVQPLIGCTDAAGWEGVAADGLDSTQLQTARYEHQNEARRHSDGRILGERVHTWRSGQAPYPILRGGTKHTGAIGSGRGHTYQKPVWS